MNSMNKGIRNEQKRMEEPEQMDEAKEMRWRSTLYGRIIWM